MAWMPQILRLPKYCPTLSADCSNLDLRPTIAPAFKPPRSRWPTLISHSISGDGICLDMKLATARKTIPWRGRVADTRNTDRAAFYLSDYSTKFIRKQDNTDETRLSILYWNISLPNRFRWLSCVAKIVFLRNWASKLILSCSSIYLCIYNFDNLKLS